MCRTFRTFTVPVAGGKVISPSNPSGKSTCRLIRGHTNAAGYELIAKAVLEALKDGERFREHVGR